ncbi:MAG TPA: hypothetical protein VM689_01155 [Aliidongia sp.]|nr:hypothetical protein [Aliidongia sp.]
MRPSSFLSLAGTILLLQACSSGRPAATAAGDAGCVPEREQLLAASQDIVADTETDYWLSLRKAAPDNTVAARRVTGDLDQLGAVIDKLTIDYGLLKSCRLQRADKVRQDLAAGTLDAEEAGKRLARERQIFLAELDTARGYAGRIAGRQSMLQDAAERLVGEGPAIGVKLARAVAAPPLPNTPYRAVDTATIYAKPSASSGRIAELRRGQRVQGPGGGPAEGWVTLYLNDGSLGYVQIAMLKPVEPNPVAATTPISTAPAKPAPALAPNDPTVALALAARQTVPGKDQSFVSLLDASAETAAMSFAAGTPESRTAG